MEFVPKSDPMVAQMLRYREDVFPDYTQENFRKALLERGTILNEVSLTPGGRHLIAFKRRSNLMTTDRVDRATRWQSLWGELRARLRWPRLNATPLSRVEVILAILAAAFLLVPEVRDLGYSPYSIEVLLAACASALLMMALVVFQRFLPVIGAIFIGMAFVSFLDLYFFNTTPIVILAATIILAVCARH